MFKKESMLVVDRQVEILDEMIAEAQLKSRAWAESRALAVAHLTKLFAQCHAAKGFSSNTQYDGMGKACAYSFEVDASMSDWIKTTGYISLNLGLLKKIFANSEFNLRSIWVENSPAANSQSTLAFSSNDHFHAINHISLDTIRLFIDIELREMRFKYENNNNDLLNESLAMLVEYLGKLQLQITENELDAFIKKQRSDCSSLVALLPVFAAQRKVISLIAAYRLQPGVIEAIPRTPTITATVPRYLYRRDEEYKELVFAQTFVGFNVTKVFNMGSRCSVEVNWTDGAKQRAILAKGRAVSKLNLTDENGKQLTPLVPVEYYSAEDVQKTFSVKKIVDLLASRGWFSRNNSVQKDTNFAKKGTAMFGRI